MKKFKFLLYIVCVGIISIFSITSTSTSLQANESTILQQKHETIKHVIDDKTPQFTFSYSWYTLEKEEKNSLLLYLELDFVEDFYTYDPKYPAFPTSFKILNEDYTLYYPQVEKSYDPLTGKELKLYSNTLKYFILLNNSSSLSSTNLKSNSIELQSSFLICSASNCMPYTKNVTISLPTADSLTDIKASPLYDYFISSEHFFVSEASASSQVSTLSTINKVELSIENNENEDYSFDFAPLVASSTIEATSFLLALILGLTAGFILNFMPCVLPVVAIKINSLLQSANFNPDRQDAMIRTHALYFSLGIVTLFTFLAFLFGFFEMMWGAIFQNVYFIIFLASIIFLFALSFLHVFTLPMFNISTPKTNSSKIDSYFQGLVTTLIATPCSGPLLGSTLGFSLTLPIPMLILVFISTGLGMALPYLLLALFPPFIKFIPRSGAWTEIMEKILAFILLLTVLYLISILPEDLIIQTLAYLLSSAFFLYLYSFFRRSKRAKLWAVCLFILHVGLSSIIFSPESEEQLAWQDYSYSEFKNELGNTNIIVDFTADWCPTCQVLKETVLTYENLKPLVDAYNIKLVRVDMTKHNKAQQDLLQSINSASIPVLALFRKDIFAYSPILLRDVYTFNQLKHEIEENF